MKAACRTLAIWAATAMVGCGGAQRQLEPPGLPAGIDDMDPGIQRQIRDAHATVSELLATAGADRGRLARAFGELGMVFHAYHGYERARASYLQAAELDPSEARWPYFLALSEHELGNWKAAQGAAEATLELRPGYQPAKLLLAELDFDRGEVSAAEARFAELTEEDPTFAPGWTGRARCALVGGRPVETVEYAREALAWDPKATETHYLLGQAYSALGEREAASRHFDALPPANLLLEKTWLEDPLRQEIADLKIDALGHTRKGARAFFERSYRVSLLELEQALAANPGMIHTRYAKALVLKELGETARAIEELEILLSDHSRHEPSLNLLGELLLAEGEFEEATTTIEAALAANSGSEKAHKSLATIHRLQGRYPDALRHYARALELDPGDAVNHFWMAATRLLAGEPVAAQEGLARARSALPGDRSLALLELRLALKSGASDGLVEEARRLADESATVLALETTAMALAASGRYQDAVRWQESAVAAAADGAGWAARRLNRYRQGRRPSEVWERDETLALERASSLPAD